MKIEAFLAGLFHNCSDKNQVSVHYHRRGKNVTVISAAFPVLLGINLYAAAEYCRNGRNNRRFCGANSVTQVVLYRSVVYFDFPETRPGNNAFYRVK